MGLWEGEGKGERYQKYVWEKSLVGWVGVWLDEQSERVRGHEWERGCEGEGGWGGYLELVGKYEPLMGWVG